MFGLGFNELLLIGVFIVVLFFGAEKMTSLAKAAGKITGEYKKGKLEAEKELKKTKKELDL